MLATHAQILGWYGDPEDAQTAGMEALTLAERLDMPMLVSEIITTLSGLKKSGPREALRAALTDAVERAERTGALHAELRGRYLLGRSHEDAAEWAEADRWFRSASERGVEAGLPWAPFCLEARWQLAWVKVVTGEWDEALRLTEISQEEGAPVIPRAILEPIRLSVLFGRGTDIDDRLARLRGLWEREGSVAIHAGDLAIRSAGRRGDATAALAAYDDSVAVLGRIWHEWFGARIRLAAVTLDAISRALPQIPAGERAEWAAHIDRLHSDGVTVLERYSDPSGFWGPEGRAWSKRLDAETLRGRWLAGVDAPPQDVLVDTWRETEQLFAEFGHVAELAQVRVTLAGILRATGDAAGARELGDLARASAKALGAKPMLDDLKSIGSAASRSDVDLRHPDRPRGRDPGAGRGGPQQRRDRQAAVHQREDRERPRVQHPRQARAPPAAPRPRPSPGGAGCSAEHWPNLAELWPSMDRGGRGNLSTLDTTRSRSQEDA